MNATHGSFLHDGGLKRALRGHEIEQSTLIEAVSKDNRCLCLPRSARVEAIPAARRQGGMKAGRDNLSCDKV